MTNPVPTIGWQAARAARAVARLSMAMLLLVVAVPVAGQQAVEILGVVEESGTGRPIAEAHVALLGTVLDAVTGEDGRFRIAAVPIGEHTLRLTHLAYGDRTLRIDVAAGPSTPIRITLSETAIELEPIAVAGISREQRVARGAGYRLNVVSRSQLAQLESTNASFADALRQFVPSVRSRSVNLVGASVCIELRTIRATLRNECLSPAVYLDGVPITNPTLLYGALDIAAVESIEVIPAAEAGARFGTGALYGALLIETRRPGDEPLERALARRSPGFDWSQEQGGHSSVRSFLFGLAGNAAGLALGVSAAQECIGTRAPSNDRIIALCDGGPTFASATAALVLPALGGAIGSRVGGATENSRGRLLPAVVGGAMALLPAYGLLFSAKRMDSDALRGIGVSLLVLGVPAVTTLADHQFRNLR